MNILSNTYYKTLYNSLTKLIDVNKIENEIGDNSFFVASTQNNKRLTLIINYLTHFNSSYYNDNTNKKLNSYNIGDLIELISNNDNVIVPYTPIYQYNNVTYSVSEMQVTIDEYKKLIENNIIALYYVGMRNGMYEQNNKTICIRYNKLKNK